MSVETILNHQPNGDAPVPPQRKGGLAAFKKVRAFLLGYDIFISYRRKDANAYALALANRLTKLGFRCYLDQLSAPTDKEIPEEVLTALRHSTALVIIGTPGAVDSKAVATEVRVFAASKRIIIPISVEGTLGDGSEVWGGGIRGLSQADETWQSVRERKRPSGAVLVRLTDTAKFRRRNKQLQRTFFSLLAGIGVVLAVGLIAALFLWREVEAATLQAKNATDQATAAEAKRVEADTAAGEARRAADDAKKLREDAETALGTARVELGRVGESLKVAQAGLKQAQSRAEAARAEADEQARRARKQRRIAASQELAASATAQLPADPEAGVLLARDAFLADSTPQARAALRRSLLASHVRRVVGDNLQDTVSTTFDQSGVVAATVSAGRVVRVWDVEKGELLAILETGETLRDEKKRVLQIDSLAFSPDGQYLAGASRHDSLYLWRWREENLRSKPSQLHGALETPEGGTVSCLKPFGCHISTVAFTSDSAHVAAAGETGVISVWETATGKLARRLSLHTTWVKDVLFSPDGRYLASASDGRVLMWDWSATVGHGNPRNFTQAALVTLRYHALSFDDGGSHLAVAANSSSPSDHETFQAEVYEVETGRRRVTLTGHTAPVNQVSFSRDGQYVLTASHDGTARLWNWSDPQEWNAPVVLRGHDGAVLTAALSPDGRWAVTGGADSTARVWRSGLGLKPTKMSEGNISRLVSVTQSPLGAMWGHRGGIREARFGPDGRRVLTIGADETVRVWEANLERVRAVLPAREDGVQSAVYSPDGKHVVTVGESGDALHVWPVGEGGQVGEPIELSANHDMNLRKPSFSPDGRHIVAANNSDTYGQEVYVWDWHGAPGAAPVRLHLGRGFVHRASFSHDREGRYVVIASGSSLSSRRGFQVLMRADMTAEAQSKVDEVNLVRVWDWRAPRGPRNPVVIGPFKSPVKAVFFSYDAESRYVAMVEQMGVRIFDWRLAGTPEVAHLSTSSFLDPYYDVAFSPDGRYLAVARLSDVEVWDWQKQEDRRRPVVIRSGGEYSGFSSVAFSPDGELLVTSDKKARVQVWDVRTGVLLSVVGERDTSVSHVFDTTASFSPDGTSILTALGDDARIYECPECADGERLLALVSARVTPQRLLTGYSPLLLDLEKDEGSASDPEGRSWKRLHQFFRRRN